MGNPVLRLIIMKKQSIKLPKTAKRIKNAVNYWADIDGSIYCISDANHLKGRLIKKTLFTNKRNGYKYVGIKFETGYKTKRVHRIIAETFVANPNNYSIVGHKNNIKTDNRVANLYWTTISENTKKAFADGLAKNAKGFDDSQSKPVRQYETNTNKLISTYGSIIEASEKTGIPKTTIARQAKYKRPVRKPTYFRYIDDEAHAELDSKYDEFQNKPVNQYETATNKLIATYESIRDASKKTGIYRSTIARQVKDKRPVRKSTYFRYAGDDAHAEIDNYRID